MSLYEASKDLHDYLRANVPDIIDISMSSPLAEAGITRRLQALHDALKEVDATDMPLPLIACELRTISYELAESDSDAWRSNISMLRDIAGDLEARPESTNAVPELGARSIAQIVDEAASAPTVAELAARSTTGSIPAGYKLLKDTTFEERSYPEHQHHENGNYHCTCCECGRVFQAHKRTVICKACSTVPSATGRNDPLMAELPGLGGTDALKKD